MRSWWFNCRVKRSDTNKRVSVYVRVGSRSSRDWSLVALGLGKSQNMSVVYSVVTMTWNSLIFRRKVKEYRTYRDFGTIVLWFRCNMIQNISSHSSSNLRTVSNDCLLQLHDWNRLLWRLFHLSSERPIRRCRTAEFKTWLLCVSSLFFRTTHASYFRVGFPLWS